MNTSKRFSWPITSLVLMGVILGGAAVGAAQTSPEALRAEGQFGRPTEPAERSYEPPAPPSDPDRYVELDTSSPDAEEYTESHGQYSYHVQTEVNGNQSGTHQQWNYGPDTDGTWQQVRDERW